MYHLRLVILFMLSNNISLWDQVDAAPSASVVHVTSPEILYRHNGYDHREALFGRIPYGESIKQQVHYVGKNTFCTETAPNRNWKPPFILMIDRGGCAFHQKVRNAQNAGASAVVIADNICLCKFSKVCSQDDGLTCERNEPMMANDGSDDDINIPSIILFKQDADPIKSVLMQGSTSVYIQLSWSIPSLHGTTGDQVEYEIWTSPGYHQSHLFKSQFKEMATALASYASFTPHMVIEDGRKVLQCNNDDFGDNCNTLCTNNGRYCDGGLSGAGLSGADVVTESLRSLCIWELYGKDDGVGMKWWDYTQIFIERCDNEDVKLTNQSCARDVMNHVSIDETAVDECMESSGGLVASDVNKILDQELNAKEMIINTSDAIFEFTTRHVYVNGVLVYGSLNVENVFSAICSAFAPDALPEVCSRCAFDVSCDVIECIKSDPSEVICNSATRGSDHRWCFLWLLIGSLMIVGAWVVWREKYSKYNKYHLVNPNDALIEMRKEYELLTLS